MDLFIINYCTFRKLSIFGNSVPPKVRIWIFFKPPISFNEIHSYLKGIGEMEKCIVGLFINIGFIINTLVNKQTLYDTFFFFYFLK